MAEEVGAAFVSLLPSAKGFSKLAQRELKRELRGGIAIPVTPEIDQRALSDGLRGQSLRLPVELDPLSRALRATAAESARVFSETFTRDAAGRLRDARGRFVSAERQAQLGLTADVDERQLRGEVQGAIRAVEATRPTVNVTVKLDRRSLLNSLGGTGGTGDSARDGGALLGRLFTSGFGSGLLNPLIGIPVLIAGVLSLPLIGAGVAAATLAGGALGVIFAAAFALRADPALQAAATGFLKRIGDVFTKAAQPLREPLIGALDTIAGAFERQAPNIRAIFAAVAPMIPVLADGVRGFIEAFLPAVSEALPGAMPVIQAIANALPDLGNALGQFLISMSLVAPEAADFIGKFLRALADLIRFAGDAIEFMARMFTGFVAFMKAVGQAVSDVVTGFQVIFELLRGDTERFELVVSEILRRLILLWKGLPSRITEALGNLGSLLYDAGRNVVQGLINGMTSKFGALGNAASSLAGMIRNYLPFSPAKVGPLSGAGSPFRSGQAIARDLAGGVESRLPAVESAAAQLAGTFSPGVARAPAPAGISGQLDWAPGASGDPLLDAIRDLLRVRFGGDVAAGLGSA